MKTAGKTKRPVEPAFLRNDGLRLLLFGGKGGVGKTTCAAAAAITLALRHPQKQFLLVSTDPAHSLLDCFDGSTPPANLTLREIDPIDSLKRFKEGHEAHLHSIALRGTFLDEADVTRFLDISMPGLDEIMALLEISAWVKQNGYACILVDTAPAGHTLRLLALPEIMRQWVLTLDAMLAKHRYLAELYRGVYKQDAVDLYLEQTLFDLTHLAALLQSTEQCRFVPVMTAEFMSLAVTRQMLAELGQLALPVQELVINRLHPAQEDCSFCTDFFIRQSVEIEKLKQLFPNYGLWGLPLFLDEMRGVTRLSKLWQHVRPLNLANEKSEFASKYALPSNHSLQSARVSNPSPLPASSIKLMLFAGKGGVGKTTLSCASALHFAQRWREKEILLFSIDPANSLAACLGCEVGSNEVRVAPGLTVIEMDAQAEYARLKQEYSNELRRVFDRSTEQGQAGVELAFDRDVMERILDMAPPGLDEVLALTRIVSLMERGQYDLFILDTAPTGHLLRFLEMPELIEQWLKTFFALFLKYREIFWLPRISQLMIDLSRQLKMFRHVLTDAGQAMLVAVTIPSEMAFAETKDLLIACGRLGVTVPALMVNMVTPGSACPVCSVLRSTEERVLAKYEVDFPDQHRTIVFSQKEPLGIRMLRDFGCEIYTV